MTRNIVIISNMVCEWMRVVTCDPSGGCNVDQTRTTPHETIKQQFKALIALSLVACLAKRVWTFSQS